MAISTYYFTLIYFRLHTLYRPTFSNHTGWLYLFGALVYMVELHYIVGILDPTVLAGYIFYC
jgi:hypothetical protein